MWSCGFQTKHPVELVFHLPSGDPTSLESHGLSKISVWNYNRGIKVSHWEARSNILLHVVLHNNTTCTVIVSS